MAPLSPHRRLTAKLGEIHDKLQEGSQWEEVYEALTDLQEVVVEEPRDTLTAIRDMATNNLGSDIQDANAIANRSRS